MIPFCVPQDNYFLNLNHVVSMVMYPATEGREISIDVRMSDGRELTFDGKEAEIVTAEVAFCLAVHRSMQQQATGQKPLIVTPANGKVL